MTKDDFAKPFTAEEQALADRLLDELFPAIAAGDELLVIALRDQIQAAAREWSDRVQSQTS